MDINIRLLKNSCFIVESEITKVLVDPCISKGQLLREQYDFVLVSHGHMDHALNLQYIAVPIYGNRYVSKWKSIDRCIEGLKKWKLGDITVFSTVTFKHPHWLQSNVFYDFMMYPWTKIARCGENTGFIFELDNQRIYYTSDTLFNRSLFQSVEHAFHPNIILYCVQPNWLLPKLLMTEKEAKQLTEIFSGRLVPIHTKNLSFSTISI